MVGFMIIMTYLFIYFFLYSTCNKTNDSEIFLEMNEKRSSFPVFLFQRKKVPKPDLRLGELGPFFPPLLLLLVDF